MSKKYNPDGILDKEIEGETASPYVPPLWCLAAAIVDLTLLFALTEGFWWLTQGQGNAADLSLRYEWGFLIPYMYVILFFLYFSVFESTPWKATPGKKLFGMEVLSKERKKLGFDDTILRVLEKCFSLLILGLGALPAFFNNEKAMLHDLRCDTRVFWKID